MEQALVMTETKVNLYRENGHDGGRTPEKVGRNDWPRFPTPPAQLGMAGIQRPILAEKG